jgi:phage terminase large subunit GpA-like protein
MDSPVQHNLIATWRRALLPPPKLTVSEWADRNRKLSAEASAEPGQWDTSRAEFQRGIMDAVTDPNIHIMVVKKSSQVGWTEILNNILGYHIDQDPCPIMVIQPTEVMAEAWSKDRLSPMIRDTPCLREKVKEAKAKDSGNTILHKKFPGGHLTAIGANAPSNLASRPIRIILADEVDRYPPSAGSEGDPVNLAKKRTQTFFNWKLLMGGSPTVEGISRTEKEWLESDQRLYFVPCPDCGEFQYLKWAHIQWPENEPENAYYACEHCGSCIQESHKHWMIRNGEWRATQAFNGVAGFHIWEAYSPWSTWGGMATEFLKAKRGGPLTHQTFVNTSMGEVWQGEGERVDEKSLLARRELYSAPVPRQVLVLTAGVDVQKDRLEVEIKGWGVGEESWSIDYRVIYGQTDEAEVWKTLDFLWQETFTHETGAKMLIDAVCIDSGYATKMVYDYCRNKRARRIFCIKGRSGEGIPAVSAPSRKRTGLNRRPVELYILGVDSLKGITYQRLRIAEPGPGYFHFPVKHQPAYFEQLTAEAIQKKFERGYPKLVWTKIRPNNEVLDCTVYATAALILLNPPLEQLAQRFEESGKVRVPQAPRQRGYRSRGIA